MLGFARRLGSLCLLCTLTTPAWAEGDEVLRVTRSAGAEACPDAALLLLRVEAIRGRSDSSETSGYLVVFARDRRGFSASIGTNRGENSRVLRDAGPSCAALERATAVTLALLFDSDAERHEKPAVSPLPEPPRADRPEKVERAAPTSSPVLVTASLGGGALSGVLAPLAPALFAEGGLRVARFRTSIGLLGATSRTEELAPGTVRQSLTSGFARTCLAPLRGSSFRLDLCSGVYAGILAATASGYTQNESVATPWLALPLEIALASVPTGLGWELGATALVPLRHHEFVVDGVGLAYDPLPVAVLVSFRVGGSWPL
jgi:hypothetical protein